jgi:uncharacterized membrane protein YadS
VEATKPRISEDWLSVYFGGLILVLALLLLFGRDMLGWAAKSQEWIDLSASITTGSAAYSGLAGLPALLLTYAFLLVLMGIGARMLGAHVGKFALAFTLVFFLAYLCRIAGAWAYIAATPNKRADFGIDWSLSLTAEAGYIIALLLGLVIGNFMPGMADRMREALRPELYVKTAIVILGGTVGVKAAEQLGLATSVMFRGLCAIIEAYLIYWAVVYFVSRKYFKFSREWAVPLASGISICGVSAAIATGSAIRARPIVPVMVSSLVVIFAVVELILLPFVAQTFLYQEPMVAGAWMGLAVKTDGAAVASGAITDSLILAKAAAEQGIQYERDWIMNTATTVKVFIDIFIGVWAFILAWIWSAKIEPRKAGDKVRAGEIWERFPKFVIGYIGGFAAILAIGLSATEIMPTMKSAMGEANIFRGLFFSMTFLTIGVVSNFKKLWEEGIARLAAVYVLCLFGFIIWVGLLISWLFFHGVTPPVVGA